MDYKHITSGSSHVTVKLETGEQVQFEGMHRGEGIERSEVWHMEGYVGEELRYEAIGYFSNGEFEKLEDIEPCRVEELA